MRKELLPLLLVPVAVILGALVWQAAARESDDPALQADPGRQADPALQGEPRALAQHAAMSDGDALYDRFCLACHGVHGDGKGPAAPWLWPRPRDFTRGEYKWRSTATGAPPTDDDLARAIRLGVAGTSMHAFGATLRDSQVASLIVHIKGFARDAFAQPAEPIAITAPPAVTEKLIARGKTAYSALGCVACHGESARGDGLAASALRDVEGNPYPPYDLTTEAIRRPGGDNLAGIYTSLATGLAGTAMPAYATTATADDLWAVAAYVDSIRHRQPAGSGGSGIRALAPSTIQIDREHNATVTGYWPGHGLAEETALFGSAIGLQGKPPEALAPAQASLSVKQCTRCHAKQAREWQDTIHAAAASPGLFAQFPGAKGSFVEGCLRCHAPLAEQNPRIRAAPWQPGQKRPPLVDNPRFDSELEHEAITCAACHVRRHQRHGPPLISESRLLSLPGYPLTEMRIYERSDFCLPCHQLPASTAVNGRPLLDTYREWLEGPYMPRGVQCQHCHMPNREHTWKGVHDPDTFRQGFELAAIAGRSAGTGAVSVRVRMTNIGAGHYLPTTPTPAAWLRIELVDRDGVRIRGAHAEKRIGRHLATNDVNNELEDTRIPPGQSTELAGAWKDGQVADATAVRVVVRVEPDEYYERMYRAMLGYTGLAREARELYEEALQRTLDSKYVAVEQLVPIR